MRLAGLQRALPTGVRRHFLVALGLAYALLPLPAATLERLSLDEMTGKSTAIVRGKVTGSWMAFSGSVIYTHYQIQVTERFKGSPGGSVEVVTPGGVANGLRQSFSGAPELQTGEEYVLFLWTGRNNVTQVIGLTQGLFSVAKDHATDPTATRAASHELMIDRTTGQSVKDQTLVMRMSELRSRITATLGGTREQ